MFWIILCIIIAIILYIKDNLWKNKEIKEVLKNLIISILTGISVGIVIFFILGLIIGIQLDKKDIIVSTSNIYGLEDRFSYDGTFILGFGNIEENARYYYMQEVKNKGLILSSVDSNNCYIKVIEDDSIPRIEKIKRVLKNEKLEYIAISVMNEYYILYIPKDTIKINYQIDLE